MTQPSTIAGVGVGLRHQHFQAFLDNAARPNVPWVEVHSENFFSSGSAAASILDDIRTHYPLSAHCVGLSLGSAQAVDTAHLANLKTFITRYQPTLVSDHVSWSGLDDTYFPDLLPLPYTQAALTQLVDNISHVQDALGRQILVENPSSYITFADSDMSEPEFLLEVAKRSGCGLLLDVNNIYVSAHNHNWNANDYLHTITQAPAGTIQEIHVAGFSEQENEDSSKPIYIDDHGAPVKDDVWHLYSTALQQLGPVPSLVEWDNNVPDITTLLAEKTKADAIWKRTHG